MNTISPHYTLYMIKNSPFARMVRIAIAMSDLNGKVEMIAEDLTNKSKALMVDNPKGQVPKFVCDDRTIMDSKAILQYLAGLTNNLKLVLEKDSFQEKVFETSRDVMEAAKANFYERKKDNNPLVIAKNENTIREKIVFLNDACQQLNSEQKEVTAAIISIICAVDYAENRGQFQWRTKCNNIQHLSQLHDSFSKLTAFVDTMPDKI